MPMSTVFGCRAAFLYQTENGNPAIRRDVLTEFWKLSDGKGVRSRGDRAWRLKRDRDGDSRQVD